MIRNVVMGRLRPDLTDDERTGVAAALDGIAALQLPGLLATSVGPDAGLRDGAWSFAIVNDWQDAEAYRSYDVDAEHNEYRAVLVAACEQVARVQLEL